MGNTRSAYFDAKPDDDDVSWSNSSTNEVTIQEVHRSTSHDLVDTNEKNYPEDRIRNLDEFEQEFARKREKRKEILAQKKKEMEDLRDEVQRLREENEVLRRVQSQLNSSSDDDSSDNLYKIARLEQENETLKMLVQEKGRLLHESEKILQKNRELRVETVEMQQELQRLNNEMLHFEKERKDYKAHVVALKDVIAVSKNMLQIREGELTQLKAKIEEIEKSLAEKEIQLLSRNLRAEYERQMANIRDLRSLYEERQRATSREKEELTSQLNDAKKELEDEQNKNRELQERIEELENDNSKKYDEIKQLESNMGIVKAESRQYQAELTVINQLFSEILLGFNSTQEIDLDKLQKHLEQHHGLLQDIVVNEVASSSYALPKVLLDLVNQVEATKRDEDQIAEEVCSRNLETIEEEAESATSTLHSQMNSAEEIVENLPKVWRVLIELLSHHVAPVNALSDDDDTDNPCYKTVETPKGPSVVLSVSQTFIRLKDLILEKKSLEKETNHLKELNGHLENRLQDQEKRLELVQSELSKTWLMVGKLQKQHQLLHTQEKILRYELAQKRKLLTQLKEELEYSREKWAQAREKNSNTEEQWRQLRTEFASRKSTLNDDANNSAESGYSDDKECSSSDEEPSYDTDEVDEVPKKIETETNLNASTNTLTDSTVNEIDTVEEDHTKSQGTNIQLENTEHLTETLHEVVPTEPAVPCDLHPPSEKIIPAQPSNTVDTTENIVEKTWERVSDIVQQEILRLTDQTKKTDFNPEMFLLHERLGTSGILEQTEEKTDPVNVPSTSKESQIDETVPSTSRGPGRSLEEVLIARNERFKRLEEQAQQLRAKVVNTNKRSDEISNKLDSLHEAYGQSVDSSAGEEVRLEDSLEEPGNTNQERTEQSEENSREQL